MLHIVLIKMTILFNKDNRVLFITQAFATSIVFPDPEVDLFIVYLCTRSCYNYTPCIYRIQLIPRTGTPLCAKLERTLAL